jgi:hypothetical protein
MTVRQGDFSLQDFISARRRERTQQRAAAGSDQNRQKKEASEDLEDAP